MFMARKALRATMILCAVIGFCRRGIAAEEEAPTREDFDAIVERLQQAESEIQQLKQQPGLTEPSSAPTEPGTATEATDYGWAGSLQNLQQRFDEFRTGFEKKKYPFVEVHGAVQVDSGWYGQDATSIKQFKVLKDGADFRRTRLGVNGAIAENVNYFLQMDFAFPGRPSFTDVWVELTKLPLLGNLRIGQWKQPFSLEVVSSFRYTMLPERSLLFNSFTLFRHIGVGFYDWSEDERITLAASV